MLHPSLIHTRGMGKPLLVAVIAALATIVPLIVPAQAGPDQANGGDTLSIIDGEVVPSNVAVAVAIAQQTFISASHVVIARDDEFADALASGVLQGSSPLLLVPSTGPLPTAVTDQIRRLGATEAVVLGGPAAVGPEVVDELRQMGLAVSRREGGSRFETAVDIAASDAAQADTVLLARAFGANPNDPSQGFADALAAGGLSARTGYPILLTQTASLTAPTRDHLQANPAIRRVVLLGGTAAISGAVEAELRDLGYEVARAAGSSRAATAVEIARMGGHQTAQGANRVIVADGSGPQAWAAGFALAAHAAAFDAPIVLDGPMIPPATEEFLATGIGGDPSSGPVLTCAVVQSRCESLREVAQLPPRSQAPAGSPLAGGEYHSCRVAADGTGWCWGRGDAGQLGNGDTRNHTAPVQVERTDTGGPVTGIVAMSSGAEHSCALLGDGTGWCWGRPDSGRLGYSYLDPEYPRAVPVLNPPDDTVPQEERPDREAPLTGITTLSAGGRHTCATVQDGRAWCWGEIQHGQLGSGFVESGPVARADTQDPLTAVTSVTAGREHSCGRVRTGAAWCWGNGEWGQVGDGSSTPTNNRAVQVQRADTGDPLLGVRMVTAGLWHTCAALEDGTGMCWGRNTHGQLGNDLEGTTQARATVVRRADTRAPLTDIAAITAGAVYSCALRRDGMAWCWGDDQAGQLGNGDQQTENQFGAGPVLRADTGTPLTDIVALTAGSFRACANRSDGTTWCWGYTGFGQTAPVEGEIQSSAAPIQQ